MRPARIIASRAVNDYAAGVACVGWHCPRASGKVRSEGLDADWHSVRAAAGIFG
ncbi:hypothetical protein [Janthinobacterium sp. UMAB-56]|uniref:hypothetical protein n=1 Tax=Janthinobacterium sp. UMAB-56 TaxID=1365361 RepID=UPI001C578AA5|nr:hypothetical protein [Janthinobacterium sp. UMAB-56]